MPFDLQESAAGKELIDSSRSEDRGLREAEHSKNFPRSVLALDLLECVLEAEKQQMESNPLKDRGLRRAEHSRNSSRRDLT